MQSLNPASRPYGACQQGMKLYKLTLLAAISSTVVACAGESAAPAEQLREESASLIETSTANTELQVDTNSANESAAQVDALIWVQPLLP